MNDNESPRTKGRSHSIIKGGDGRVLYDSDNDKSKKSSNTIRGGDGKILYEDKE
jgi:hypothetical protein